MTKRLSAALLPALLLAASTAAAQHSAEQLRQLQSLQDGIAELQTDISKRQGERSALQQQLDTIERTIDHSATTLRQSRSSLAKQAEDQRLLHDNIEALERHIATQRGQMRDIMRHLHRIGPGEQLRLLLNAETPRRLVRLHYYHRRLSSLRHQRIDRFRTSIGQLRAAEQQSRQLAQHISSRRAIQREQRGKLQKLITKHRAALGAVDGTLLSRNKRLKQLEREQRQLQELLEGVQQQLPPRRSSIAKLRHRLPRPVKGTISKHFGTRRAGGMLRWRGIRIDAPDGTPVRALHAGRVVFAQSFADMGLLMILDHGAGYLSVYGNNQSLLRSVGDEVDSAETIATVGRSGGQRNSGLYFELRHQGKPRNPLQWFESD